MANLLIAVGPDELLGLQALAKIDSPNGSSEVDDERIQTLAGLALRDGITRKLDEASLPWAPSSEAVDERLRSGSVESVGATISTPPATAGGVPPSTKAATLTPTHLRSTWGNDRVRRVTFAVLGVATLIVLLGGYVGKWSWTGFEANDQVWDWLHLLLLPVALGTVPLWVTYSERMSQARKLIYAVVVVAFIGFVVAGYLVPINWTGFSGNSLWNWLTLIVLPVTLATIRAWPKSAREIRTIHIVVFSALGLAWMVTLLGGYLAKWQWTGYPGNTMWDWLQLLLAPIVISTVLVPAAIRWVSGDVARLAAEEEAKKAAEAAAAASGTASAPAPAQP